MVSQECNGQRYLLPKDFSPSADDVMIGRGRSVIIHNAKFYRIIDSELAAYSANNRTQKSFILVRVLNHIKEVVKGKFVKKDKTTDMWYSVEEGLARSTVAQALRDALHTTYRSSKQFKQQRRKKSKTNSPLTLPPTTMVSALACAQEAKTKQHQVSSFNPLSDTVMAFGPAPSVDDSFASRRDVLSRAAGIIDAQELEDTESLNGVSSASQVTTPTYQDILVSSSLMALFENSRFEGNPFEPTPLKESDNSSKVQGQSSCCVTP